MNASDQLPTVRMRVTRSTLVRYCGASGDFNPIHYSQFHAETIGLPGVVAHGMWTMGSALQVVTNWIGDPRLVTNYRVRFTKPVVVPDTADGVELVFSGEITHVTEDEATVAIKATCGENSVLGAAEAKVRLA